MNSNSGSGSDTSGGAGGNADVTTKSDGSDGSAGGEEPVGAAFGPRPGLGDKTQVLVTIDLDALTGMLDRAGITSTGEVLSPATVRRLACDAGIIPAILGSDGQILDLGRTRRLFTPAQRLIVWRRDKHCSYPGCTVPATWCDVHHAELVVERRPHRPLQRALCCAAATTPTSTPTTSSPPSPPPASAGTPHHRRHHPGAETCRGHAAAEPLPELPRTGESRSGEPCARSSGRGRRDASPYAPWSAGRSTSQPALRRYRPKCGTVKAIRPRSPE